MVIAIIAILAALLMPALRNARGKANQMKCISNLRQLGLALGLYMNDTNGCYPIPTGPFWWDLIGSYVGNPNVIGEDVVWICPTGKRATAISNGSARITSYAINGWSANNVRADSIAKPSEKLLAADGGKDYVVWWYDTGDWMSYNPINNTTITYRHNNLANVLWCDLHVSPVKYPLPFWQARWDTSSDP